MAYVSRSSSGDFPESGQIWQNLVSGRGEIWKFGFCQGPGGAGIHLGGSVLMSGPQKPNYFLNLVHLGITSGLFSCYLEVSPGGGVKDFDAALLAPIGAY